MQLSFSLLAVATALSALVSAHPALQLKRVTTTPATPTTTTALADAGIPTHASTITDALPAAINTTPPSSCTFPIFFLSQFVSPNFLEQTGTPRLTQATENYPYSFYKTYS